MNELISFLQNQDVEYQIGKILSSCTAVGIGGRSKLFISPDSSEKLIKTLGFLSENKLQFNLGGNMSNVLPRDIEVHTPLVSTLRVSKVEFSGDLVFAECGTLFSRLILLASKRFLGGCEALFGIPGTVGAMLYNNAGAYGGAISDFLETVDVYDPTDNSTVRLKREEVGFFYRDSELKRQKLAVIGATFRLNPSDKREIEAKLKEIRKNRANSQPLELKNLGSVFKRTESLPASYIIDRCGLKGARVGKISVSDKHAGFFVNEGGGTAEDFLKLCDIVKSKVREKYGVVLEEEFEYLS